jgi:hypothetical protein
MSEFTSEFSLFYYYKDKESSRFLINYENIGEDIPNKKGIEEMRVFPLYDNEFKKVGYLKTLRNSATIDKNQYTDLEYHVYLENPKEELSIYENTICFGLSFIGEVPTPPPSFYTGKEVKIPIIYCSGRIYNKTGIVKFFAFDNEASSVMLTFELKEKVY